MVNLNKGATVELVKALSDDIRTLPDGTKAASAGAAVREQSEAISIINPMTNIQWTLGKSIDATGVIANNQYMALSQKISCTSGDKIARKGNTLDANGKFLTYYVSEFCGDTFVRRTELAVNTTSVVIGSTTTHVYVSFGRYGSSGITLTQEDIDTYGLGE